jgi:AraC-like DNA-binding protein
MMFNKTADSESAVVLNEQTKLDRVFDRLGKDEASELEILRTARDMGMTVSNLRSNCTVTPTGLKRR